MTGRSLRLAVPIRFCAAVLLFGILETSHAGQSGNEKLVKSEDLNQITDAVMITDISVAGKSVQCGLFTKPRAGIQPITPFEADSDWLRSMTISMMNRTNKRMVFASVMLVFLDTGDCFAQPCAGAQIHVGQMPAVDAYDGRTGQPLKPETPAPQPLAWKPYQILTIPVAEHMDTVEDSLKYHLALTDVTKVAVHLLSYYYEDGMRWTLGRYSVPDPEHPGKYKYLPEDYFPGRRGKNWPPGYGQ